jgi:hypothetical protein
MEQEFSNVPPAPKKNNTLLIVAVVIAVLLCCCCLVVIGGFVVLGPTVNQTFEDVQEGLEYYEETPYQEELPSDEGGDSDFGDSESDPGADGSSGYLSDFLPSGGLTDETLRMDVWLNVNFSAAFASCVIPEDGPKRTTIEVIAEPDGSGNWAERWTIPCDDGSTQSYEVSFSPSEEGGTIFTVSSE